MYLAPAGKGVVHHEQVYPWQPQAPYRRGSAFYRKWSEVAHELAKACGETLLPPAV